MSLSPRLRSTRLAVDPLSTGTVYADAETAIAEGLYRSADGGVTWSPLPGMGGPVVFDPQNPMTVHAVTRSSLPFRTTIATSLGGGVTWTPGGDLVGLIVTIGVDPVASSTLYAGTWFFRTFANISQLWKSVDGGTTWTDTGLTG